MYKFASKFQVKFQILLLIHCSWEFKQPGFFLKVFDRQYTQPEGKHIIIYNGKRGT